MILPTVECNCPSPIILDEMGAETLLGRGDLLYRDIGNAVRLQGLFVKRGEMEVLVAGNK